MKCGSTGVCLEIIWTGLISHKKNLMGKSSIIIFPIYGMAFLIGPMYARLSDTNIILRGFIYTITIFTGEFLSGAFLKQIDICPWDYSKCKYNILGLIRLDYTPVWFATGLIYELILKKDCPTK